MNHTCFDILNEWAKYIDYDEQQKTFNLLTWDWELHHTTKTLKHITETYDPSGLLAVLKAKRLFFKILENSKISLMDALVSTDEIEKHRRMKTIFEQPEIKDAEDRYIRNIQDLIVRIIGYDLIGTFDNESLREKIFAHTDNVVTALDTCRVEFYQKGDALRPVQRFSTKIHLFPTLAKCILSLSAAEDGMYLCFIEAGQTADCWFGFFIKDGNNLLSVNERIDETFKGQHANSRNGRWTEQKADNIFPYDFVFEYSNYDLKGYSQTYTIHETELDLHKMEDDAYLPILIAMGMVANQLKALDPQQYTPVFIDSLLAPNIPQLTSDTAALSLIQQTEIVQYHKDINLDFDYDAIMDGTALNEFKPNDADTNYNMRYVVANNTGQIFVDLYGKGFQITHTPLSTQRLLPEKDEPYIPEFIGSEKKMRAQAWHEIRQQLADYIRDQMYLEYQAAGGIQGVKKWFREQIANNMDKIENLIIRYYTAVKNGTAKNITDGWRPTDCPERYYITLLENTTHAPSINYGYPYIVNEQDRPTRKTYDLYNGKPCKIWFIFQFLDWKGLENMFGAVPKIVKGWSIEHRRPWGNTLLDITDPVEGINTPFENCRRRPEYIDAYIQFTFAVGFSKSGLNILKKKIDG